MLTLEEPYFVIWDRAHTSKKYKTRCKTILFVRYNIAQLEQWARDQKIEDTETKVIDTLLPIIQVKYRLEIFH